MTEPQAGGAPGTSHWTPEKLLAKRKITDPLADDTVKAIIASGYEKQINAIIGTLVRTDTFTASTFQDFAPELQKTLNDYFTASAQLPDWADQNLIKKGEEFYARFGPEISMLLNVKSLPLCYACAHGARVLYDTGRLMDHGGNLDPLARRLMETAQMVVYTMMPGGLAPGGKGVVTVQKVRLIHASIRYYLKNPATNPQGWDTETLGEPINQEDMAGTLMSFSALILDGLKQMHLEVSDEEAAAYMHCWSVVGHLTGVEQDLIPTSYTEGYDLGVAIMKNQAGASDWGKALTSSCIAFMQSVIPGNYFDGVAEYMIWYFVKDISTAVGKDLGEMIGVTDKDHLRGELVTMLTDVAFRVEEELAEHSTVVRRLMDHFNIIFLQSLLVYFNHGKQVRFYIPPSLQADWKLQETWADTGLASPALFGRRLSVQKRNDTL